MRSYSRDWSVVNWMTKANDVMLQHLWKISRNSCIMLCHRPNASSLNKVGPVARVVRISIEMALPPRNPLTNWHKIWKRWLRRERHSIPQMACQSVQGVTPTKEWNVNGLFFFCLFFNFLNSGMGQTTGPILTSDISKSVSLRELHSVTLAGGAQQYFHKIFVAVLVQTLYILATNFSRNTLSLFYNLYCLPYSS